MAAIGAGGQLGAGILQYMGQQQANDQNAYQFQSNQNWATNALQTSMEYDAMMSNTAMERRVNDLQRAGLNPILAVNQGGASTPTVSENAPGVGNSIQNPLAGAPNTLSNAVSNAMQAMTTIENVKNTQADTGLKALQAVTENAKAQRETSNANLLEEQTNQLRSQRGATAEQARAAEQRAKMEESNMATDKLLHQIGQGAGIVRDATQSIGNILYPWTSILRGGYSETDMLNAAQGKGVLVK